MRNRLAVFSVVVLLIITTGATAAASTDESPIPTDPKPDCTYISETDHYICGAFEEFWWANGGVAVFGYPLTDAREDVDPATGQSIVVQYFERQRLEWHPENPAPYNVLLGHAGSELLDLMGQDWTTFPTADPGDPHFVPATGHAIAPEFWPYWSAHGLDLGDAGVTFRESVMLFGYPISEPREETNADGDTVLTQWFERARFEYHPDLPAPHTVLLGRLGADLLGFPSTEVLATGLHNPRGMVTGPDGAIYIAEAGHGGDTCITIDEGPAFGDPELCFGMTGAVSRIVDGQVERVVSELPSYITGGGQVIGPQGVALSPDGTLYVTLGYALHPEHREMLPEIAADLGYLIRINDDGSWTPVVDLAAYELANNPEPEGGIHSNPYALLWVDDGLAVTDAAGNDLLHVTLDGEVTTLATFPPQMVEAPPSAEQPAGTMVPMASVPTSVTQGPDGALYVGEFNGFPFTPGKSRVWRVVPGQPAEVHQTGLTAVIALDFDPQGNLYVLEAVTGGLGGIDPSNPVSLAGALLRVKPDGSTTVVAGNNLVFPTSVHITGSGDILVANFGMVPQRGTLIRIDLVPQGRS